MPCRVLNWWTSDDSETEELHEVLVLEEETPCPIEFQTIRKAQEQELRNLDSRSCDPPGRRLHSPKWFFKQKAYGSIRLWVTRDDKICIPTSLQRSLVEWYHKMLCHPGEQRLAETLVMRFFWAGLRAQVRNFLCSHCDICQRFKAQRKQYGTIPLMVARDKPWETVAVLDLIGPWTIPRPISVRRRRGPRSRLVDTDVGLR